VSTTDAVGLAGGPHTAPRKRERNTTKRSPQRRNHNRSTATTGARSQLRVAGPRIRNMRRFVLGANSSDASDLPLMDKSRTLLTTWSTAGAVLVPAHVSQYRTAWETTSPRCPGGRAAISTACATAQIATGAAKMSPQRCELISRPGCPRTSRRSIREPERQQRHAAADHACPAAKPQKMRRNRLAMSGPPRPTKWQTFGRLSGGLPPSPPRVGTIPKCWSR